MVSLANKINNDHTVASDNWVSSHGTTSLGAVPSTGALTGFGIFFIVVSSLALAGVVIAWMVCECTSVPAGRFRVPRQPKMTYQQNVAVPRGITAGDAALWGAGALAASRHAQAAPACSGRSPGQVRGLPGRRRPAAAGRHPAGDPGPNSSS